MLTFLFPLGLAIGSTVFILLNEDFGKFAKALAFGLTVGSIVFFFTPVHFLVPLAMQMIVCIWVAMYWQMQR